MTVKLKMRNKWNVSLSIESDNDDVKSIKNNNDAEDIKIKDITDVKNEDECCLKILNDNFNFTFKLNK